MAKEKFDRSKPHVNIGTIGHVDHGKTDPDGSDHDGARQTQVFLKNCVLSTRSTTLLKKKNVVSPSTPLASSIRRPAVTMLTWTARATPTM